MSERADNDKFSKKMQPVAIAKFYVGHTELWPSHSVIEVDNEFLTNPIARALDIGGTDKLLRSTSGYLIHLGQRFRREDAWYKHCELTIRDSEWERHLEAIRNGGTIPEFYSYGFANKDETDFIAFFVINYRIMMRDIRDGDFNLSLFKRWERYQHDFYRKGFCWLPKKYERFSFINAPYQPVFPEWGEQLT